MSRNSREIFRSREPALHCIFLPARKPTQKKDAVAIRAMRCVFFIKFSSMKNLFPFLIVFLLFSCKKERNNFVQKSENLVEKSEENQPVVEISTPKINRDKNTVRERFDAPEGFKWKESIPNSYGHFIENFKLKPYGTKILQYNGTPISNQNMHEAVFDISVGTRDLQQCADAIIRLRAEYLKSTGKEDEIAFQYTSGDVLKWSAYKNGERLTVRGNTVSRAISATADSSDEKFKNYLENIFMYAGTISQNRETKPITKNSDLKTGDILITAGSPGHVVFIAGVSENKNGERLYLLGEGFTPAQSISVMKNPNHPEISPWYELDVNSEIIRTSRYVFKPVNFRRY